MKLSVGSTTRRRTWLVIAVWCLVIFSMLVPIVFLLRFNSLGYLYDRGSADSYLDDNQTGLKDIGGHTGTVTRDQSEADQSGDAYEILTKSVSTTSKDVIESIMEEHKNKTIVSGDVHSRQQPTGLPMTPDAVKPPSILKNSTVGGDAEVTRSSKDTNEEGEVSCELKYGSYCLWRQEHKEKMKDSMVKRLKDNLFVARAYFPSIAKLPVHSKLSRDMKQNIQEFEHILIEATTDVDLPSQSPQLRGWDIENIKMNSSTNQVRQLGFFEKIKIMLQKMESVIARAKAVKTVDCNNVYKKFAQLVDLTEDEANFHMKQSAFLYHIAVETLPKSLHCLYMRLTVEYFSSSSPGMDLLPKARRMNPAMQQHYVILSTNVLALSVVINSSVSHSKETENLFFHVLTDTPNYFAMKQWFINTTYKEAIVQVLNIEDLNLHYYDRKTPQLTLSDEFRVTLRDDNNPSSTGFSTDYLSVFSQAHFLLPEIFENLNQVIVLDDDVVVQQDLSDLWNLNLEGKVIAAVPHCKVRLGKLKKYLGENIDDDSCTWMSGLNVVDLARWREQNVTGSYNRLLKENLSKRSPSTGVAALRATLLALQNKVYALDQRWALSGLGHDYSLSSESLKNAGVLHYNGKMKPWLDLGIPKYKSYWKKYLNEDNQFLSACNINT